MTTTFDTEVLTEVLEILNEFGITAVFTVEDGQQDLIEGEYIESTTTPTTITNCSPIYDVDEGTFSSSVVEEASSMIVVPGNITFAADIAKRVNINGFDWVVVAYVPYYSGDDVAAYLFALKK
jgi:hypothetical protein